MKISVAIATFNGAEYIAEQLSSILTGSVVPDQVVLADDESTDDTVAIARRIFDKVAPPTTDLVIVEGDGQLGVVANFERAIAASDGDVVVLSDQDDVWHKDRLAAVVPAFEADDALLLVHSDARLVDAAGEPLGVSLLAALTIRAGERSAITAGDALEAYIRRNLATGATVAFRRSLFDVARPFPAEWIHDEWLATIAAATGRVSLIERELIDYRQHGKNQIGVAAPTFGYRLSRFLEPRGDRYGTLARRATVLRVKLERMHARIEARELVRDKERFELARSVYPRNRLLRVLPVIRQARKGSYSRLSSQGSVDILRDILQPA